MGSLDISEGYRKAGKSVRGMMQFDMTAWVAAGRQEEIGVVTNLADSPLSEYTKLLIEKYRGLSPIYRSCSYIDVLL